MQFLKIVRRCTRAAAFPIAFLCVSPIGLSCTVAAEEPQKPPVPTQTANPAAPKPGDPEELPELPRAKLDDGVFAQSGDVKIMDKDVNKILALMITDEKKRNPKNVPSPERLMRGRIEISQILLQNALIEKYARDNKLETRKEDVDKYIELKKGELQRDGSTFEQMLVDTGWTEAEYRNFWGSKIAIEKHAAEVLTDAEIDAYFEKNKAEYPLRSAAHILFQYKSADSAPPACKRTKDEARAAAEEALKQLKAGKDFAELVNSSDDESSKANGGALAFFPLVGKEAMVESFGKAVYALQKVGDLAPVVETLYGFHVIKLTGIRDKEIKTDIRRYLAAEKFNDLVRPVMMKAVDTLKFNEALTPGPVSK